METVILKDTHIAIRHPLFGAMIGITGLPALLVAIGFMFAVFGEIPISDVLIGRVARGPWRSRAFAMNYLVGFAVSASSLPLIAWIYGDWGFDALFGLLAVAALLIASVVLYLPQTNALRVVERSSD